MPDDDPLEQKIAALESIDAKYELRTGQLKGILENLMEKVDALEATINDRFESIISDYKSDETENWKECAIKRGNITKKINELAARIDKLERDAPIVSQKDNSGISTDVWLVAEVPEYYYLYKDIKTKKEDAPDTTITKLWSVPLWISSFLKDFATLTKVMVEREKICHNLHDDWLWDEIIKLHEKYGMKYVMFLAELEESK